MQQSTIFTTSGIALAALGLAVLSSNAPVAANPGSPLAPDAPSQNASAFAYQGQIRKEGALVTGSCAGVFSLFDSAAGGVQVGPTVSQTLTVTNGLFTVALDFGWVLRGEARWLETAIGCGEAPTTLSPRVALRPAPYAFALPGMRTLPSDPDLGGNPTMNVIGGVVSGAISNTIDTTAFNSAIVGGVMNRIGMSSTNSLIGGGRANVIGLASAYGTIAGGEVNVMDHGAVRSTIGGGNANLIDSLGIVASAQDTIAGGNYNRIYDSYLSVISGGGSNYMSGQSNASAIGGGYQNEVNGAVGGVVPGGRNNSVSGNYGFAAGFRAKALHAGAFVWGDSTAADVASTAPNQFTVRAANGLRLTTDAGGAKAVAIGERYRDNAVIAWGKVSAAGSLIQGYGVSSVITGTSGIYTITLTASTVDPAALVPTANAELDAPPTSAAAMRLVMVNQLTTNSFAVYVSNGLGAATSEDFTFLVTGR